MCNGRHDRCGDARHYFSKVLCVDNWHLTGKFDRCGDARNYFPKVLCMETGKFQDFVP
jgi:hypothetical protein